MLLAGTLRYNTTIRNAKQFPLARDSVIQIPDYQRTRSLMLKKMEQLAVDMEKRIASWNSIGRSDLVIES